MAELTKSNPYYHDPIYGPIWEMGFATRQKSPFTPVSVTGRWWQSSNGKIYFAHAIEYDAIQRSAEKSPGLYRWLSDEETREF